MTFRGIDAIDRLRIANRFRMREKRGNKGEITQKERERKRERKRERERERD